MMRVTENFSFYEHFYVVYEYSLKTIFLLFFSSHIFSQLKHFIFGAINSHMRGNNSFKISFFHRICNYSTRCFITLCMEWKRHGEKKNKKKLNHGTIKRYHPRIKCWYLMISDDDDGHCFMLSGSSVSILIFYSQVDASESSKFLNNSQGCLSSVYSENEKFISYAFC